MQLLKIELPDTFTLTQISFGGSATSNYKSTWIYKAKE